jgi:hypothetical protein
MRILSICLSCEKNSEQNKKKNESMANFRCLGRDRTIFTEFVKKLGANGNHEILAFTHCRIFFFQVVSKSIKIKICRTVILLVSCGFETWSLISQCCLYSTSLSGYLSKSCSAVCTV